MQIKQRELFQKEKPHAYEKDTIHVNAYRGDHSWYQQHQCCGPASNEPRRSSHSVPLDFAGQPAQSSATEAAVQISDVGAKSIAGSWYGSFSSPDFGPLPAMFTFGEDGTVVETDGGELQPSPPDAPYYTGPGHGAWRKIDKTRVSITFMIIPVNADGTLNSTGKVSLIVTLSGADAFSGTGHFAFFDADGTPIEGASGDESVQCTRIKAD